MCLVVQLLLSFGCDVDVKDWQGNSSVHQAIVSNVPTDICRTLFAKSTEDVFADDEFKRLYLVLSSYVISWANDMFELLFYTIRVML